MNKSSLIKTSVAAIVSAFVFTAGVPSASAKGDDDGYGHASKSDGYKGSGGSYGGHYRKHYSHKPHYGYRRYGHHPKHYSSHAYNSYGNYGHHYRKHYSHNPYKSYGSYATMAGTSPYWGWQASPYAGSGPYAAYGYSQEEYRKYNGMVCAPGTLTKMDDGKMYRCQ
jgi:hypothetical protein